MDLFTVALIAARELEIFEGQATGGSTTTVVDASMPDYPADYFENGAVFVTYDAGGASAAPQGEFQVVQDYNAGTKTLTTRSQFTAAVASGDRYAVLDPRWPLYELIGRINQALQKRGKIEFVDTSITTASAQTEYTLPFTDGDLQKVSININTNDANDNQWVEVRPWRVQQSAVGSADLLIIPNQLPVGHTLRLSYRAIHPDVNLSSSSISDQVQPVVIAYEAAYSMVKSHLAKIGTTNDPHLRDILTALQAELQQLRVLFPKKKSSMKSPKYIVSSNIVFDPDSPPTP